MGYVKTIKQKIALTVFQERPRIVLFSSFEHFLVIIDSFRENTSVRTTMHLNWTFWDILGQFRTFRDISGHFGRLFDEFGAFEYKRLKLILRKASS